MFSFHEISATPRQHDGPGTRGAPGVSSRVVDSSRLPRQSPRLIGRYVVHEAFARGGMATIHFARLLGQQGFTRTIAVKHLFPHLAADDSFVSMFLEEARLLSRVRHPNVVAPLDIIGFDTELFIAMEYVHGQPISFLCNAQQGPVPARLASAILTQVLLGLHAVHEATSETGQPLGIVHRDVSPQNILIDLDGIARLVDFGIAKAASRGYTLSTARGLLKGKLGYLAPEQLTGQGVDRRTDVYMAGIVLWELLTGRRLFAADTPSAMFELLAAGSVSPPSAIVPELPAALNAVVLRALALNKEHRFESARAMATALAQAAPPAATIELGLWAETIAGPELRKRAARIAEIETLDLNPAVLAPAAQVVTERIQPLLHKTQPIPKPNDAPAPSTDSAQRAVTAILFAPNSDTQIWDAPTPTGVAPTAPAATALAPTAPAPEAPEGPPAATETARSDVTPLPPLPLRSGLSPRSKMLVGALAAASLGIAVLATGFHLVHPFRASRDEALSPPIPARAPAALTAPVVDALEREPAEPELEPSPAPVPSPAVDPPIVEIAPSSPAPTVRLEAPAPKVAPHSPVARRTTRVDVSSAKPVSAPVANNTASPVRSPNAAPSVRSPNAASPVRSPNAASPVRSPNASPPVRSANLSAQSKSDCTVPYRVDEHGIKRFRAECF
jgi:eukaryotic-like serine/threonine-protein kinase